MYYVVVKMSSGWYGKYYKDELKAINDVKEHISVGNIVVIADDLEAIAEILKINKEQIEIV